MNISGIRTLAGFYDYNIKKGEDARQIEEAQEILTVRETLEESERKAEPEKIVSGETAWIWPEAKRGLEGAGSNIIGLDVKRALSDVKKDEILQQYQYFIGEDGAGYDSARTNGNEDFPLEE